MTARRRIGLLGGTFDPVHVGHLDAAEAARAALALDEVWLVPAHDPPHKPADPRATPFHRFALVALAIDGHPALRACDMELAREGPSYTVNTLRALHAAGWAPWQIFFITGADAFADVATWREYPAVLDAAHFAVIARPGSRLDAAVERAPGLVPRLLSGNDPVPEPPRTAVFLVSARTRDVSSTVIRARLAAGQPIDGLVPAAVARHIHAHGLYVDGGARHGAPQPVDHLHGQDEQT